MTFLKHWRHLSVAMLAIVALGALAACGDDEDAGRGMIVTSQKVESLDPHYSNFAPDIALHRMLWRGLYSLDADNRPVPAMAATDPEVSADGTTYTITLRDDLQWSDGDDLAAEDFVAAFHRTCNPVVAGNYYYLFSNVVGCDDLYGALAGPDGAGGTDDDLAPADAGLDALEDAIGVTAVNGTTLEITLIQAQPTFPLILAMWTGFPVPVHIERFANQTPDAPADWGSNATALAYNGPYVMTAYSEGEAVLGPNPNFKPEHSPLGVVASVETLTIRFVTGSQADAFRTGEIHVTDADVSNLESQTAEFGDRFFQAAQPGTRGLGMLMSRPPLDKLEVRLALSQAIDRETLNRVAAGGAYVPTTSWLPEDVGGHAPGHFSDQVGYDPEKARANLAAAGYPNGEGFPVLSMIIFDAPDRVAQAEQLQKMFKDVLNIDTTIERVDQDTRATRLNNEDFELAPRSGWIQDYPDPENWIIGLFNTGGGNNIFKCSDPDIDDLMEKAAFNTNNEERLAQYKEINELIVTRVCGNAPYYHEASSWLVSDDVTGFKENSSAQNAAMPGDWAAEAWGFRP